jgi:Protein of unknown function (DUF2911)
MQETPKNHKETAMKKFSIMCSLFLFAFGSLSYAAGKESGSVSFPSAVRVGTNNLPAGTYAIHWQPGSSDAKVTLSVKGNEISVPAKVTPGVGRDEVLMHRDGKTQVVEGFTVKATTFTITNP